MPSCLFYLFSVSVSWWSPSRGPILIASQFRVGAVLFQSPPLREKLTFMLISSQQAFNSSQQNYSACQEGAVGEDVCAGPRCVVGEVMKERRRRERERLINLSTCGCMIQLYLWENTQFIEIREFGWGFLMLTS